MSRSGARITGRARPALVAAALCALGLLAMATHSGATGSPAAESGATGKPVSSSTHSAAAAFSDVEYSVPFYGRIFNLNINEDPHEPGATKTYGTRFFGEVAVDQREAGSLDLSFAVEGQPDASDYQFCRSPGNCYDVMVQITPQGLLYLYIPRDIFHYLHVYLGGFSRQPVEVSATDAESGLKVYREVQVGPSPRTAACEDYGDDTPEAYTCLFLRELLPAEPPAGVDEATLRAGLPDLVQPGDNYSLVFAEDYDGTPPPANDAGCRNGLSTLDNDVWLYYDACDRVDGNGTPCANVADGVLFMGDAQSCAESARNVTSAVALATHGKLHFKYGYIELKYEINLHKPNVYSNFNVILWPRGQMLRFLTDQYGVAIESWEDYLKHLETEIDIFEWIPQYRTEEAHQYLNWFFHRKGDLWPIRTNKWSEFCNSYFESVIINPEPCKSGDTFTVTRGMEWTPSGYRTFIKVDGIHDEMILVPREKISVERRTVNPDGTLGRTYALGDAELESFFDYVDPTDTSTLLEQAAVAHIPLPIAMSVWGSMNNDTIGNWMKIDYIRVWQPTNLYTDMEPVYQ